jgi:hypothetical protein
MMKKICIVLRVTYPLFRVILMKRTVPTVFLNAQVSKIDENPPSGSRVVPPYGWADGRTET